MQLATNLTNAENEFYQYWGIRKPSYATIISDHTGIDWFIERYGCHNRIRQHPNNEEVHSFYKRDDKLRVIRRENHIALLSYGWCVEFAIFDYDRCLCTAMLDELIVKYSR